jgi:hypothetical protein
MVKVALLEVVRLFVGSRIALLVVAIVEMPFASCAFLVGYTCSARRWLFQPSTGGWMLAVGPEAHAVVPNTHLYPLLLFCGC